MTHIKFCKFYFTQIRTEYLEIRHHSTKSLNASMWHGSKTERLQFQFHDTPLEFSRVANSYENVFAFGLHFASGPLLERCALLRMYGMPCIWTSLVYMETGTSRNFGNLKWF